MYKLTDNPSLIERTSDEAIIPADRDNADYLAYLAWVAAGNSADPAEPPQQVVPKLVTAAQGGIALIQAGLMDSVMAAVNAASTPAEIKWAWSHAQTWERDSQALLYLSSKAAITSQQMDKLFVAASKIEA